MRRKKRLSALIFVFAFSAAYVSLFAQGEKKIKVAVLPPSASGDASASVSQGLTSVIVTELSRSPSLEVSDRRDVEKALKEQAFGLSGCTDQSCQIEIGKILQSKWVVTGDLNKIGTLYILTLKILNVETSQIVYQDEEEYKGEVEGLVPKTKALTSRLADFLLTGKKTVKPVEKEITQTLEEQTFKGGEMVYIPAGEFWMGSHEDDCKPATCGDDEKHVHGVYLNEYYMDMYEVTNAQYKLCVDAGKCKKPLNTKWYNDSKFVNHPVVNVNWIQADAYCTWAGKRLPTEAEWEKAARGEPHYVYPWGNEFDCKKSCNSVSPCNQESTCAVGSFPGDVSSYGVYDMGGNVWEWVSDWYDENYYKNSPENNPKGPKKGAFRGLRGESWNSGFSNLSHYVRATRRGFSFPFDPEAMIRVGTLNTPSFEKNNIGFRCAAD